MVELVPSAFGKSYGETSTSLKSFVNAGVKERLWRLNSVGDFPRKLIRSWRFQVRKEISYGRS
jgi:hypothetical protein